MDRFASIEEREQYLRDLAQKYRQQMCVYFASNLDAYKRQTAEDLVQELFAGIIRTVRNKNKPLNYPDAYLYAAAKHLCSRASKEKVPDSLERYMTSESKGETEPVQLIEQSAENRLAEERTQKRKSAIDEYLTGNTRNVMKLVAEGLSVREIAIELGISQETVRQHRAKGKKLLQERRELSQGS